MTHPSKSRAKKKPVKPPEDFPLFAHGNGQLATTKRKGHARACRNNVTESMGSFEESPRALEDTDIIGRLPVCRDSRWDRFTAKLRLVAHDFFGAIS